LVSFFNEIKLWSSMLAKIPTITPPNVQIQTITQSGNKGLTINGYAQSYDNVNDFLLTLKNSAFLNSETTKLATATMVANPGTVVFNRSQLLGDQTTRGQVQNDIDLTLPKVVLYTINTEINDKSAQELLSQLNRRGAIGLVSRITNLQRKGAFNLQPVTKTTPEEKPPEGETKQ
ncbi:PilN domain-containing protein, partial [Geminocystis sp. GBBB08]|uniref:PilN domain-containing protein n=1 Tax=Geminocystis sp. GBBB08 TaxID=2604140 RepID=UPI0027E33BCF